MLAVQGDETVKQTESGGVSRRRVLTMAGLSAGAAMFTRLPAFASDDATASAAVKTPDSAKNSTFGQLKQIDAGPLNVSYAEAACKWPSGNFAAWMALRYL